MLKARHVTIGKVVCSPSRAQDVPMSAIFLPAGRAPRASLPAVEARPESARPKFSALIDSPAVEPGSGRFVQSLFKFPLVVIILL